MDEIIRQAVVAEARTWLGTPYHHRARVKGAGVDCGMILIEVFSCAGAIENFEPQEYSADWMMHRETEKYLQTVERFAKKVNRAPLPGDIALFRFGRCISHGAIVTEWPRVLHAYRPSGQVIEENIDTNEALNQRLVGFWSL